MLYQGKNPTMNRNTPATRMTFSPMLRAPNLSINLSIETSYDYSLRDDDRP